MKIQEVTIEGYQSHTNSTFRLSSGLTVITGPSDAGKTAIIRALRWFAFNEPTGEAFLHTIRNPDGSIKEAVDQVKVSVTFDNGITITKTRRKGKTTYTHSAFPTAWEKAEIPPEIKETLGLVKQQYGDFETCLNFAFQLDAPFMLSESASVGAKVLGKLAGTEIVDKSISEVNKKTHQTRNDISYADKQIGEIDVSLTEYFDLDRFDAELKIAEAAFTKLKEDQSRHVTLTALMNSYQLNTEQRIKYYDEVERLAGVVVASVSLGIAEREQAKKEKLEDLNVGFWKAVQDQNEPLRVWRKGEVDFNDGKSLDGLSWSSFFPSRYDASYCNNKSLKTVQWYINTINKWKNAGTVVQVIIPAMNINRSMKIKTFQGDYEGQELDYYYDLEFKEYVKLPQVKVQAKKYITVKKRDPKPVSKPSTSKNKKKTAIKKGDKVQFKGGPVYISSDASRPAVTRGKAKCNCTIVNSNKHPYHLIHYSGAMVYGWVNASDCEKI